MFDIQLNSNEKNWKCCFPNNIINSSSIASMLSFCVLTDYLASNIGIHQPSLEYFNFFPNEFHGISGTKVRKRII